MSKYIVSIYDDEKSVYNGASALDELDYDASLTLYEGAIVSKDASGAVTIRDWHEEGPVSTLTGMMLGSLIGVIAGPAGVAVGAATGSMSGLLIDASRAGANDEFLADVMDELSPGKFALAAEIDEGWTMPLDSAMEKTGGVLHRAWRIDVEDEQIDREIEANQRELAELQEEWQQADDEAKEKLQAKIDATKAKLTALSDRIKEKVASMKAEYAAKIEKIDQQIAKASQDFKSKYGKARADLKADYQKRNEKLKQAGSLVSEALA